MLRHSVSCTRRYMSDTVAFRERFIRELVAYSLDKIPNMDNLTLVQAKPTFEKLFRQTPVIPKDMELAMDGRTSAKTDAAQPKPPPQENTVETPQKLSAPIPPKTRVRKRGARSTKSPTRLKDYDAPSLVIYQERKGDPKVCASKGQGGDYGLVNTYSSPKPDSQTAPGQRRNL